MTAVNSTAGNTAAAAGANIKPTGAMQQLGKDAFLQLLVTQLRYQDPLNPQDNSAFVAQMAQFTSLEQMQNLNDSVKMLVELQTQSQGNAPAYLGLTVTVATAEGNVTGTVSAVEYSSGKPMLVVDGKRYGLESLLRVVATEKAAPPAGQPAPEEKVEEETEAEAEPAVPQDDAWEESAESEPQAAGGESQ